MAKVGRRYPPVCYRYVIFRLIRAGKFPASIKIQNPVFQQTSIFGLSLGGERVCQFHLAFVIFEYGRFAGGIFFLCVPVGLCVCFDRPGCRFIFFICGNSIRISFLDIFIKRFLFFFQGEQGIIGLNFGSADFVTRGETVEQRNAERDVDAFLHIVLQLPTEGSV